MFVGQLHPYQEDDVDRAIAQKALLIAYAMGTGKTIMTIAALEDLMGRDEVTTALIVVPASLRMQWAMRVAEFTDVDTQEIKLKDTTIIIPADHHGVVITGTATARFAQYAQVRAQRPSYVIVSYETVVRDWEQLIDLDYDCVVLDEAQAIKTAGTQRTKTIKKLRADYRLALTGMPMDNGRPEEVYSIMNWVDSSIFGRWDIFDKAYVVRSKAGFPVDYQNMTLFHTVLSRAMARKTAEDPDVRAHLPRVEHLVVDVDMDMRTLRTYLRIARDLEDALEECSASSRSMNVASLYTSAASSRADPALGRAAARASVAQLLLDHPDLVLHSAALHGKRKKSGDPGSAYAAHLVTTGVITQDMPAPKLAALVTMVHTALEDPRAKIAIFTRYRAMLPILHEALAAFGPVQFHGEMDAGDRAVATARFSTSPDCRILLLTDAGGAGLDLPVANYVINFDFPLGSGMAAQRNTRHVRANSQHTDVRVIDLIVRGSIEEHALSSLTAKQVTMAAAMDNAQVRGPRSKPSLRAHLARHHEEN